MQHCSDRKRKQHSTRVRKSNLLQIAAAIERSAAVSAKLIPLITLRNTPYAESKQKLVSWYSCKYGLKIINYSKPLLWTHQGPSVKCCLSFLIETSQWHHPKLSMKNDQKFLHDSFKIPIRTVRSSVPSYRYVKTTKVLNVASRIELKNKWNLTFSCSFSPACFVRTCIKVSKY